MNWPWRDKHYQTHIDGPTRNKPKVKDSTFWAFGIENTRDRQVTVAVLAGFCDTFGIDPLSGQMHYHNAKMLREFDIKVDSVLDDADDDGIIMRQMKPRFSPHAIRRYLRLNYHWVKQITVNVVDSIFNLGERIGEIQLASLHGLERTKIRDMNLKKIASIENLRSGYVQIPIKYGELQLNDLVYMGVQVPPRTEYVIQIEIYDSQN